MSKSHRQMLFTDRWWRCQPGVYRQEEKMDMFDTFYIDKFIAAAGAERNLTVQVPYRTMMCVYANELKAIEVTVWETPVDQQKIREVQQFSVSSIRSSNANWSNCIRLATPVIEQTIRSAG